MTLQWEQDLFAIFGGTNLKHIGRLPELFHTEAMYTIFFNHFYYIKIFFLNSFLFIHYFHTWNI